MMVGSPRRHVLTCRFVGQGTPLSLDHWTVTLPWCSLKDRGSRSIALQTTDYR